MRLFFIVTALLWATVSAAPRETGGRWTFHRVDMRDGLADNFVRDITTDSEGYVWLSTINGLSRYDGYRFVNFHPLQWGGRSGDVTLVRETADGTLWAISSEELFTYHRGTQTWHKDGGERLREMGIDVAVTAEGKGPGGQTDGRSGEVRVKGNHFHVDEVGGLWIVTGGTLYHKDFGDGGVRRIDCGGMAPIQHIVTRNGTTLVVTSGYDIYKVTEGGSLAFVTRHPNIRPESRDSRAMIDSRMNLWLYHAHDAVSGLWVWSMGSGRWHQPEELSGIARDATVNALAEDEDGRLWVGTGKEGIWVARDGEVTRLPMGSHITWLYADGNNTMWVGMAKQGAAYADLNCPEFVHTTTEGHEDVSALMEDEEGNLWIGFDGGGIVMHEKGNGGTRRFSLKDGTLPSENITALVGDGQGGVLAGTYGGGLARLEGERFVGLYGDYEVLRYVKAMVRDGAGALWVATVDKGVVRITTERRFSNYTTANSPLRSNGIMSLAYDEGRNWIYIGTSVGLAAYDCSRGGFVRGSTLDSLGNVNVTSLLVDGEGRLWIGSRDGLWVVGGVNGTLSHLTTEQGMTGGVVRALARSGRTIWASTDKGLTSVTAEGEEPGGKTAGRSEDEGEEPGGKTAGRSEDEGYRCKPFFDSDGLEGIIFSNNAALTRREGTVLLGSMTGYVSIPSNSEELWRMTNSQPNLHVLFTEFRINGNAVVKSPQGFTMNYGEHLGLSISMMVPALSHKVRYVYRLKGEDRWMRAPGSMLYFASLMPGRHVLQVRAVLPGMLTTEVSELTFRVLPPLWLRSWAIMCYLVVLAGAVWLAWRGIRRRQRREVAMKQMEVDLRRYEMEEDKIRFFTNISHDLKTPLTLVVAPLEKIREHDLPEAIGREIEVAWRNARQLYDLVLELLDFRRLDAGKEELHVGHGDLVGFVRQTAEGFAYYTTRKQIDLRLELPARAVETLFDENKMRRIITNLMSNAYKYNVDGGSVTVGLDVDDGEVRLSVADTGIGVKDKEHIFDRFVQETHGQEQEGSGLGLHIVKQYVDMMGGRITVTDNRPRGTVFTIALPVAEAETERKEEEDTVTKSAVIPTILVVEDNTDARLFLQRSLDGEYRVLTASNGKEALALLAKGDGVSIIISDVMMPVMDGIQLVRQLRKNIRYSHIPVVLLTAKSSEEDIVAGLKEGVDEYLTKPYSLAVLRLRIRKILEWTQHAHEQVATGIEIKPSEITVSSLDEELVGNVIAEVEANMSNATYSVVELSASVGMTRGTLYKKLMAITGKSPVEFIRIVRLKRGRDLLSQGRTNVSEVADQVGISPKMFAHHFREMYGETPSDYLKRQKTKSNKN